MKRNDKKFLWGVTNIGTQVEGGCVSDDWYAWACRDQVPAIGGANNYWQDFSADHDLVSALGCNAYRLTIEWARIEPKEGVFDADAVAHYREILYDLKKRNITTIVGLWHYALPAWFARDYGMHHHRAPEFFDRYAQKVSSELGDLMDIVIVSNEPMVYVGLGYVRAQRPPFYRDFFNAWRVAQNIIRIQKRTYAHWKKKYPQAQIGSAHLCNEYRPHTKKRSLRRTVEMCAIALSAYMRYGYLLQRLRQHQDFIGVNYYTSERIAFRPLRKGGLCGFHGDNDWHDPDVWHVFPAGLGRTLTHLHKKYRQSLMILENGKPSVLGVDDDDRQIFLAQSIVAMEEAIAAGADVRSYVHHSLTDCYEWTSGYDFAFGLVEIERDTLEGQIRIKRTKRKSFAAYKKIITRS